MKMPPVCQFVVAARLANDSLRLSLGCGFPGDLRANRLAFAWGRRVVPCNRTQRLSNHFADRVEQNKSLASVGGDEANDGRNSTEGKSGRMGSGWMDRLLPAHRTEEHPVSAQDDQRGCSEMFTLLKVLPASCMLQTRQACSEACVV